MKQIFILITITLITTLITSCATFNATKLSASDRFKFQACTTVYCERWETSKIKKAGLKLVEIALITQGVNLDIGRGFCEEYYSKREPANDYIYANKAAVDICNDLDIRLLHR